MQHTYYDTRTATIEFKGKITRVTNRDGSLAWEDVKVPTLTRKHCNMREFERHPVHGHAARCGTFLGADVFAGHLAKIRRDLFPNGRLRLDRLPAAVTVERRGPLALVTIKIE